MKTTDFADHAEIQTRSFFLSDAEVFVAPTSGPSKQETDGRTECTRAAAAGYS